MREVRSSNISGFEHDETTGTLTVTFKNQRTYRYHEVPIGVAEALHAIADDPEASFGSTFNRLVRMGGYTYEEIK